MNTKPSMTVYLLVMVVTIAAAQAMPPIPGVEQYLSPYSSLHIN